MVRFIGKIVIPPVQQKIPDNAVLICEGVLFRLFQWQEVMFDETNKVFEKVVSLDSVSILPVTENNEFILAEQYQPGRKKFLGLLSGKCELSELPTQAAVRELFEEGNIKAKIIKFMGASRPYEKIEWCRYYFTAHDISITSNSNNDIGENISLIYLSAEELCNFIKMDKIDDLYFSNLILKLLLEGGIEKVKNTLCIF